jgi:hypothetical protein
MEVIDVDPRRGSSTWIVDVLLDITMECSTRTFKVPWVPVSRPAAQPTETAERWT